MVMPTTWSAIETDPDTLDRLVRAALTHTMTAAERFEQRVSWVYGQMQHGPDAPTKGWVRAHLAGRS
jgi:hypothetical protein